MVINIQRMEAIIFVGIQASGKSTFYKERFFNTHVRISLDLLKTRHRENLFLQLCIATQQPFVIDNTNSTVEQRSKYITLAKTGNFRVNGYYFQPNPLASLGRNQQRPNRHQVPAKAIFGTHKQLQIPTLAEGFDALYYVAIDEEARFVVEELREGG
jgi:predicted kinase